MRRRRTAAVAAMAAGFMALTAGCGLTGEDEILPKATREPLPPLTASAVSDEISGLARAGGLPDGDTSPAGLPKGGWRDCMAPWTGRAPAADAAGAFEATVTRLREHDWEIISSHTGHDSHSGHDVTYRTLAKRGWKLYARRYDDASAPGPGADVSLTAVEDGCEPPAKVRAGYEDPA
ncbi:hypothetical protein [Streptomyces sp. NPDC059166]|uniref:hypothetical protein n=1 Tax=Streptomyces sp. NPDC059166 TaxID=3346752 RepID=UPI0036BCF8B2